MQYCETTQFIINSIIKMQRMSYRSKLSQSLSDLSLKHPPSPKSAPPQLTNLKSIQQLKKQSDLNLQFDISKFDQSYLITLNKIKANDVQFQSLIIQEQKLNLEYIEQTIKYQDLISKIKLLINPKTKLEQQIDRAKVSLEAKSNYIKRYHQHLFEKLSSSNTLIFIQQQNIINKYQNQIKSIEKINNAEIYGIEKEIKETKMKKDIQQVKMKSLFYQWQSKQQTAVSINKFGSLELTRFKKNQLMRTKDENKKLYQQKQQQTIIQKQHYQMNKSLKYLLTVEDEHNNSGMIFENCFIKKETNKVYQYVNKLVQEKDYENKIIPDLKLRIKEMKKETEGIEKKIKNKEKSLEGLTLKLTQVLQEFSKLNQ